MRICVGDLEADGLLHENPTRVWCGVFKDINTEERWVFRPEDIPRKLLEFLDSVDVLIMHNGIGYDWPLLEELYGYEFKGKKVDTLIMSRTQRPKRTSYAVPKQPHSVEAWGVKFGRKKPTHEDWSQFSEEMLHRCSEDVEIQHMIYNALLKEGKGQKWRNAHILSFKLFDILRRSEEYGCLVDQEHMDKAVHMLDHWMNRIDRIMEDRLPLIKENKGELKRVFLASGKYTKYVQAWMSEQNIPEGIILGPFTRIQYRPVSLDSNKETKEFLLSEGWKPDQWNYDKDGNRSSPKLSYMDPFEGINSGEGRLIAKRVQCKHRKSNILGLKKVIRSDGRIPQRISGLASTGRLRHQNIVNIPGVESFFGKWMRRIFISKPGYVMVGTDSAGCQNRMLAARVGDPEYTKILLEGDKNKGTSIHQVNQRYIEEIAGESVLYRESKNLNYAFIFGATDAKLGRMVGKSPEVGAKIREALLSVAPGFLELVQNLTQEWRSHATPKTTPWGKVQYQDGWIEGIDQRPIQIEQERTILVYTLQSDEAIMMQYALVFLYDWLTERGWEFGEDYAFVLNNHDEFQAEVREDIAEEYSRLAEESITYAGEYLNISVRHEGESQIGYSWADTH